MKSVSSKLFLLLRYNKVGHNMCDLDRLTPNLNGAVSRNNCKKGDWPPCRCLDGPVKEPYEMSMALGARPQVHFLLTYITEISLHVHKTQYTHSLQKEHGSLPNHIARTLTARRICLGRSKSLILI